MNVHFLYLFYMSFGLSVNIIATLSNFQLLLLSSPEWAWSLERHVLAVSIIIIVIITINIHNISSHEFYGVPIFGFPCSKKLTPTSYIRTCGKTSVCCSSRLPPTASWGLVDQYGVGGHRLQIDTSEAQFLPEAWNYLLPRINSQGRYGLRYCNTYNGGS